MPRKDIKIFDGGYGRIGKIWVEAHECNLCGRKKYVWLRMVRRVSIIAHGYVRIA